MPTKSTLPPLADDAVQEVAGGFQLGEGFAQVDDMNAVAGIEDEGLHLGIPAPGLMAEMDAGVQ